MDTTYTGDIDIVRMVWNIEDTTTWEEMRGVILQHGLVSSIVHAVDHILQGNFPVFVVAGSLSISIRKWGDFDEFIRSWAEAQAALKDIEYADDEEDMARMLEEGVSLEAIGGESVDGFNERLWLYEVDDMMDCLSEDFEAFNDALECAKTMLLAQTGQAVA